MVTTGIATTMNDWIQTDEQKQNGAVDFLSTTWLWDQRDRRMDKYYIMMHPLAMILIIACYVIFAVWVGPWLMRDRKPFSLKTPMMVYNLFQILISAYICIEGWNAGWGSERYSWICQPVEPGNGPIQKRMFSIGMVYLWNRYIQLADTFFFIARKKNNQITVLHVYHHAIMPTFSWTQGRFLPANHETLGCIMNCFAHVLLYSYYFLSALGPKMQPYLWWKKYLTILELTTFCICIFRSLIVITGIVECGYPWLNSLATLVFIYAPFFYLFLEFYRKSYNVTHKAALKKK